MSELSVVRRVCGLGRHDPVEVWISERDRLDLRAAELEVLRLVNHEHGSRLEDLQKDPVLVCGPTRWHCCVDAMDVRAVSLAQSGFEEPRHCDVATLVPAPHD